MLEISNVCKAYKKNKKLIKGIENFTYQFEKGKIYLLKGSSGKGKTTLLSIIRRSLALFHSTRIMPKECMSMS